LGNEDPEGITPLAPPFPCNLLVSGYDQIVGWVVTSNNWELWSPDTGAASSPNVSEQILIVVFLNWRIVGACFGQSAVSVCRPIVCKFPAADSANLDSNFMPCFTAVTLDKPD
jgi:hypothetical protein